MHKSEDLAPAKIKTGVIVVYSSKGLQLYYIVIEPIKGAAPPAFNITLEWVVPKQASRNPPLQATLKPSKFN